jgi:hypothetical protein
MKTELIEDKYNEFVKMLEKIQQYSSSDAKKLLTRV